MSLLAVLGLALGLTQASGDLLERLHTSSVAASRRRSDPMDACLGLMVTCQDDAECASLLPIVPEEEVDDQVPTLPECGSNAACQKFIECTQENMPGEGDQPNNTLTPVDTSSASGEGNQPNNSSTPVDTSSASEGDQPNNSSTPVDTSSASGEGDQPNNSSTPVDTNSASGEGDQPNNSSAPVDTNAALDLIYACADVINTCYYDAECAKLVPMRLVPEEEVDDQVPTLPECGSNAACQKFNECILENMPVLTGLEFCLSEPFEKEACDASACCAWSGDSCGSAIGEDECEESTGWILRNPSTKGDGGLATGAVVGIVVGVLVAVGAVVGIAYYLKNN